jgi:polyisoprenoid-binding protein YceI
VAAGILATTALLSGSKVFGTRVDGDHGRILFTATQAEVPIDGDFKLFTADVAFDPAKPDAGKVALDIDVGSVTTGNSEADNLLRDQDFLDVKRFPRASFVSKAIAAAGSGQFQVRGDFTLKGRSAEVVIPFTARPEAGGLLIEGRFPISRLAYKVGEGQWADTGTLSDQVQVRFVLHVIR